MIRQSTGRPCIGRLVKRCKPTHVLLLLMPLLFPQGEGAPNSVPGDPRVIHENLRRSALNGRNTAELVETWRQSTGDESFETFLAITSLEREALQQQGRAFRAWEAGQADLAMRLLESAYRQFLKAQSPSEAAFCLYYGAEIQAEQERYPDSLDLIESALELARRGNAERSYLLSLLLQSRGYSLWFLDRLRDATASFAEAQKYFQKLGYQEGIVTSWNNVAVLLEELQVPDQAQSCYQESLAALTENVDMRIRFQLYRNYILFLNQHGKKTEALRYLQTAEGLGGIAPFEMLLLKCRVTGKSSFRNQLLSWKTRTPTESVDRLMTLATGEEDRSVARRYFESALELSEGGAQDFHRRQIVTEFGEWLEAGGEYEEAEALYRQTLARREASDDPEDIFPYSRAESRLFDGWIRCLIALSRPDEALGQIHGAMRERTRRARGLLRSPPRGLPKAGGLDRLLTAAAMGRERASEKRLPLPGRLQADTFTLLEMWPTGDRVFIWIDNPKRDHFRVAVFPGPVGKEIRAVLEGLYSSSEWLPPLPPAETLRELHRRLLQPIEDLFETGSLLILPHKELQVLPLEMLIGEDGNYLLEKYRFSYLPSRQVPVAGQTTKDRPRVFLQRTNGQENREEESFFRRTFPDAAIHYGLPPGLPRSGSWIHISSHFLLEKNFWLNSALQDGDTRLDLTRLVRPPLFLQLLSIGACDLANPYRWAAPYWLGLPELLLNCGVRSLLVSRWKLDELTLSIYERFFECCRRGHPMDEALYLARLEFVRSQLQRGNRAAPAGHPFFWAGVTYVGVPGTRLYPETPPRGLVSCLVLLLFPTLLKGLSLLGRRSPQQWPTGPKPVKITRPSATESRPS